MKCFVFSHKILLLLLGLLICIILENIMYAGGRIIRVSHHGSYRNMYMFLSLLATHAPCNLSSIHEVILAIFHQHCGHLTWSRQERSVKPLQLKAKPCVTNCVIAFCLFEKRGKKWLVKAKSSLAEFFSPLYLASCH